MGQFIYGDPNDVLSQKQSLGNEEKLKTTFQRKRQNSQNLETEFRQLNKYLNWNILSLNEQETDHFLKLDKKF